MRAGEAGKVAGRSRSSVSAKKNEGQGLRSQRSPRRHRYRRCRSWLGFGGAHRLLHRGDESHCERVRIGRGRGQIRLIRSTHSSRRTMTEWATDYFLLAFAPVNPKICNCLLLAMKTCPLATTGTRFAFPPIFGHAPARCLNKTFTVVFFLPPSGLNAKRLKVAFPSGRDNAQIIGLAVPLDEIVVKNPGSC